MIFVILQFRNTRTVIKQLFDGLDNLIPSTIKSRQLGANVSPINKCQWSMVSGVTTWSQSHRLHVHTAAGTTLGALQVYARDTRGTSWFSQLLFYGNWMNGCFQLRVGCSPRKQHANLKSRLHGANLLLPLLLFGWVLFADLFVRSLAMK